ncbi:MAG: ankyrin repeat domain-containing protein [Candidatus Eisenbacteria bacterium]|nr:ankyrin repeat domain-containing protein [Candidatus Eisenbacteria bacterium]
MTSPTDDILTLIRGGDTEAVIALLRRDPGAAMARDASGVSALMWACYMRQESVVEALRAVVPSLDVFEAASLGDEARLRDLLAGDPALSGAWSGDGFTALHFAAFFGRAGLAKALLDAGADPAAPSRNAMRVHPLHSAAAARSLNTCRVLLEGGAPAGAAQHQGWTALMSAAMHGEEELALLLLGHGADPAARSDDGRTAADMALEKEYQALATRLSRGAS